MVTCRAVLDWWYDDSKCWGHCDQPAEANGKCAAHKSYPMWDEADDE